MRSTSQYLNDNHYVRDLLAVLSAGAVLVVATGCGKLGIRNPFYVNDPVSAPMPKQVTREEAIQYFCGVGKTEVRRLVDDAKTKASGIKDSERAHASAERVALVYLNGILSALGKPKKEVPIEDYSVAADMVRQARIGNITQTIDTLAVELCDKK